jgi:hypothetical protein
MMPEFVNVVVCDPEGNEIWAGMLKNFQISESRDILRTHHTDGRTKELIPSKKISVVLAGDRVASQ